MFEKLENLFNTLTDGARAMGERTSLAMMRTSILLRAPKGDGHPVLVLPGFVTGDHITRPLRMLIGDAGYAVHGWDGGLNRGMNDKTAAHLVARLKDVYARSGNRKVTLVGHSLGGIFARELAREYPDMVRGVVTLGSPFGMQSHDVPKWLGWLYDVINPEGKTADLANEDLVARAVTPPPVPTTAIYSRKDGVVPWRSCINPKALQAENVEVSASHVGMIYHPLAVTAVLDRLAQPEGGWRAFEQGAYTSFYPRVLDETEWPQNPGWRAPKDGKSFFHPKK